MMLPHGRLWAAHTTVLAGIVATTYVHGWHHRVVKACVHATSWLREVIDLILLVHRVVCVVLRRWLLIEITRILRPLMMWQATVNKGLLSRVRVTCTAAVLVEENAIVLCI